MNAVPLLSLAFSISVVAYSTLPLHVNSTQCHPEDEAGLLAFKSSIINDPSGMLSAWKPSTDCCNWPAVTCCTFNRVTKLLLYADLADPHSFLSGTISPALSKLRYLKGLYLQNLRNITGTFPFFLFDLPNLKHVYIENNKLSGQLPVNLSKLSNLEDLSLAGNRFSGEIPRSISFLTLLTTLDLGGNILSGEIPNELQQLKRLNFLALDHNRLSGKIPDVFSSIIELRALILSHNQFSGEIPTSFSALAENLVHLDLAHNNLVGQFPDYFGNFEHLDTIYISRNRIAGVVPKGLQNLTTIVILDLAHNHLRGPFPELNVTGIEFLDLSYNHFNLGKIPTWITFSPTITSLKLALCGVKMRLDDWKPSEMNSYNFIDISRNEITGSPIGLLNRTDFLVGFWAAHNQLRFNMTDLRLPKSLQILDLSWNLVFGELPGSISGLQKLNVSFNHLCGQIPATKFEKSAFLANDCLCGSPLPSCSN